MLRLARREECFRKRHGGIIAVLASGGNPRTEAVAEDKLPKVCCICPSLDAYPLFCHNHSMDFGGDNNDYGSLPKKSPKEAESDFRAGVVLWIIIVWVALIRLMLA